MATQSFHETKNFSCGEGGALLVNDPAYVERAEIIREKGTNRSRFFRGQVDKYTWVDIGSSYLISDMLAAFLYAQLERREWVQSRRRQIWEFYNTSLGDWAQQNGVRLPIVPPECEQAYHMFYLLMPSLEVRTRFIQQLREREIISVFHYVPLHDAPMGLKLSARPADCPVTEEISSRLVRLPFFTGMTDDQLASVAEAVCDFSCNEVVV
jgi:dTDP-4-amino-4,6-dideoxygalactose transaminase